MKIKLLLISMLLTTAVMAQYAPAGDKIKTEWADEVSPESVLPEYPRPMMVRPLQEIQFHFSKLPLLGVKVSFLLMASPAMSTT